MILKEDELKNIDGLDGIPVERLRMMCNGLEDFIRRYTANPFVKRGFSFTSPIADGKLSTVSPFFESGDTVLITGSDLNNGLYVLGEDGTLNGRIADCEKNTVHLVEYPPAIKNGVADLLRYAAATDDKKGIASETISRHSVSYVQTGSDSVGGFPAHMMAFLKPYMKARF